jgi:hypothetical protein
VGHLDKAISDVHLFLATVFGDDIMLQPSSLDLAVDAVGLAFGLVGDVKEHFITRAQLDEQKPLDAAADGMLDGPDGIKRRWRRVTGLSFGARNGQVSALLYDKTHEIKYHSPKKVWFHDLWFAVKDEEGKPVWDGQAPVWRIEIRFKRQALHEFKQEDAQGNVIFHGIDNAYELMERLPLLWAYAVGHVGGGIDGLPDGWLRYVVPTEDSNRSRWPVHPDWQVIQTAFQPVVQQEPGEVQEDAPVSAQAGKADRSAVGALRSVPPCLLPVVRKRHYEVSMRQMVAQVAGCVLTTEAWRPFADGVVPDEVEDADLSVTFHFLFERVLDYLQEKQERKPNWSCAKTIERKRVIYQLGQAVVA